MARKSEWINVLCGTKRSRDTIRSWFLGLDTGLVGPSRARILQRIDDDRVSKIAAIFTDEAGVKRELVRTMGRTFTVTIRSPTLAPWR